MGGLFIAVGVLCNFKATEIVLLRLEVSGQVIQQHRKIIV